MYKTILRILGCVILIIAVLWIGGMTLSSFKQDAEIKNPLDVFNITVPEIIEPDITTPDIDTPDINTPDIEVPEIEIPEGPNIPDIEEPTIPEIVEPDIPEITLNYPIYEKEDIKKLVNKIRVAETKNEGYVRDDFEKPTTYFYIDGTRYTRNKYAWHVSFYLNSEEPFSYICPYTGIEITNYEDLDFEHIVSLKTTFENCPDWWTEKEMNEYAYDQLIGVDVLNKANRSKGAKTPSQWLPEINIGDFCFTYLVICYKYDIAIDKTDLAVCELEIYNAIDSGNPVKFINQFKEDTEEYQRQQEWYEELKNL